MIKLTKSTIDCEECKKYPVHSTYPSATNKTKESHKQIQETLIVVKRVLDRGLNDLQEKKMKTCNSSRRQNNKVLTIIFPVFFYASLNV